MVGDGEGWSVPNTDSTVKENWGTILANGDQSWSDVEQGGSMPEGSEVLADDVSSSLWRSASRRLGARDGRSSMNIGIVGYGFVGRRLADLFGCAHKVAVYDKALPIYSSPSQREAINSCDVAFVAVPTPTGPDGISCDVTQVQDALSWLTVPTCIKSTVPPGTTKSMESWFKAPIAISPEYMGESSDHQWKTPDSYGFQIIGGARTVAELVMSAYRESSRADIQFHLTDSTTAEFVKYMENCFLATKVAFVNQFYDLAEWLGIDFNEARNLWLLDPRIGMSHTDVRDGRGFGGKCLPKDLRAIIAVANSFGGAKLLEAVHAFNEGLRGQADGKLRTPPADTPKPAGTTC
jgi:UDPglucose 6-dehydrogenase